MLVRWCQFRTVDASKYPSPLNDIGRNVTVLNVLVCLVGVLVYLVVVLVYLVGRLVRVMHSVSTSVYDRLTRSSTPFVTCQTCAFKVLEAYLRACLTVCLRACLTVCLRACLTVFLRAWLTVFLRVCLTVFHGGTLPI